MAFKEAAFTHAVRTLRGVISLAGRDRANLISARLAESLVPVVSESTAVGLIHFFCPSQMSEWRARTLLMKEPETLEWIHGFSTDDVFWDIGANVGVYSLYASLRGLTVRAFEPAAPNYYLLNRNIELNRLGERVSAYCIAFSDRTKLDSMFMANTELGAALNSFGDVLDWQGKPMRVSMKQAAVGYSIDDFIDRFDIPFPNHLKIDVDGTENKIIVGARQTLSDRRLKSVMIELNSERSEYCRHVFDAIAGGGLRFVEKRHAPEFDKTEFAPSFNYFFNRPQ